MHACARACVWERETESERERERGYASREGITSHWGCPPFHPKGYSGACTSLIRIPLSYLSGGLSPHHTAFLSHCREVQPDASKWSLPGNCSQCICSQIRNDWLQADVRLGERGRQTSTDDKVTPPSHGVCHTSTAHCNTLTVKVLLTMCLSKSPAATEWWRVQVKVITFWVPSHESARRRSRWEGRLLLTRSYWSVHILPGRQSRPI